MDFPANPLFYQLQDKIARTAFIKPNTILIFLEYNTEQSALL